MRFDIFPRPLLYILIVLFSTAILPSHAMPLSEGYVATSPAAEAPSVDFQDTMGNKVTLQDFKGKAVLLNLWATWCPPCIKEMPALNRLQQKMGSPEFEVITVNQDRGNHDMVRNFFARMSLFDLKPFVDPLNRLGAALKPPGLPVTVLIGKDGNEIGRFYGAFEWDNDESISFLKSKLKSD